MKIETNEKELIFTNKKNSVSVSADSLMQAERIKKILWKHRRIINAALNENNIRMLGTFTFFLRGRKGLTGRIKDYMRMFKQTKSTLLLSIR